MTRQDGWCILRTSGAKTLPLADSLVAAGFEAWTPRKVHARRKPRSHLTAHREMPIAPTFVFVTAAHLHSLNLIRAMPVNPHPPFSIFTFSGRIPLIADSEISGFRNEEQKAALAERRTKQRRLVMGQRVRLNDGAYAGLSGVVADAKGGFTLVAFDGGMTMKIATWLLADEPVNSGPSRLGHAA
jgi:hypothetical protein